MTKRQEVEYWKSRCREHISSSAGRLEVLIPPNIPGLKRLHKKAMKLKQYLDHHPKRKTIFKKT